MSSLPPASLSLPPSRLPAPARYRALPGDASWTALLADTTWGMSGLARHRVRVRQAFTTPPPEGLRLVVQSYRPADVASGRPSAYARPLASAQRAVSHEELSSGVQLDLVHFGDWDDEPLVIAWTEAGEPDLDYDGLEARPPASVRLARVDALPTFS
jgi:hypothetical protein